MSRWICAICLVLSHYLQRIKIIWEPSIAKRCQEMATGTLSRDREFRQLFPFMNDAGTRIDVRSGKLASRTLILTLASPQTTSRAACQARFQTCQYLEHTPMLREGVRVVLRGDRGWQKTTLTKLCKLDSFIKESYRVHYPSLRTSRHEFIYRSHHDALTRSKSWFPASFSRAANALQRNRDS